MDPKIEAAVHAALTELTKAYTEGIREEWRENGAEEKELVFSNIYEQVRDLVDGHVNDMLNRIGVELENI